MCSPRNNLYQSTLTITIIIYQSSKFSFSCVSLVESLTREIVKIKLSPSHQRGRETMHYSPVNNKKKITCTVTRTRDLWTAETLAETRECFLNDIVKHRRSRVHKTYCFPRSQSIIKYDLPMLISLSVCGLKHTTEFC